MKMSRKKLLNRLIAIGLCVCAVMFTTTVYAEQKHPEEDKVVSEWNLPKEKDYIVMAKSENKVDDLEKEYDSADVLNVNSADCLQENHMISLTLTNQEAENLSKQKDIEFIEEDVVVEASGTEVKGENGHRRKNVVEKVQKEGNEEGNVRMIRADRARKKIKKSKKNGQMNCVKVAILDSGVDYNADMNIAETISLVPGEEDVSPLFMDSNGHGTSVAGLVAAKDNGEGITGIDPYAEIYSIRVLDDDNCSPVSRVVEGIYMAIEKNVDIINMSFGVNSYSQALDMAIKDAADADILVIAAAGNTGSAGDAGVNSTVQYPAALDEVLAVGSVDQRGNIADSSATGSEISLVAPGELVRSTGMFGSEIVGSGTSLAAPQVAGAAALIMEKDKTVSPDFVRELLLESANSYGDSDVYGAGLLDVNYAMEYYDSFKKKYRKRGKKVDVPDNEEKIVIFKDTGCVEGCWSGDNHEALVKGNYKYVKKGARFNDGQEKRYIVGTLGDKTLYRYRGMMYNPWWHGYYKREEKGNYLCNYVAAYVYETKWANSIKTNVTPTQKDLPANIKSEINDDIKKIDWKNIFGSVPSKDHQRDFIWGMAIHTLADSFAHSTAVNGKRIKHDEADNIYHCPERWSRASKAVENAIKTYNSPYTAGSWSHYYPMCDQNFFQMINLYENIKSTFGEGAAGYFKNKSVKMN